MDTSKLIDSFAQGLQPVRPLSAPVVRATVLSLTAFAVIATMVLILGGPRPDWTAIIQSPIFMSGGVLMLAAGVLSAVAAFILAVPDTKIRRPVIFMLGVATVIWAGICLYAASSITWPDVQAEFGDIKKSSACIKALMIMTILPLSVSFFMALRAMPVWRGWTGYSLTLSIASFGAFGMRFFCPSDALPHLLLWHFLPVFAFSVLGGFLGKIILRFRV